LPIEDEMRGTARIREKLTRNAQRLLEPGETIQSAFPASTWVPVLRSTLVPLLTKSLRAIVATDKRILICLAGKFRMTQVNEVLAELPRWTTIDTVPQTVKASGQTMTWFRTTSFGETLFISPGFYPDVDFTNVTAPPRPV